MPLSNVQKRALKKLKASGGWISSYQLGEYLSTMRALQKKGLVRIGGSGRAGAFWSPQTTIVWKAL